MEQFPVDPGSIPGTYVKGTYLFPLLPVSVVIIHEDFSSLFVSPKRYYVLATSARLTGIHTSDLFRDYNTCLHTSLCLDRFTPLTSSFQARATLPLSVPNSLTYAISFTWPQRVSRPAPVPPAHTWSPGDQGPESLQDPGPADHGADTAPPGYSGLGDQGPGSLPTSYDTAPRMWAV